MLFSSEKAERSCLTYLQKQILSIILRPLLQTADNCCDAIMKKLRKQLHTKNKTLYTIWEFYEGYHSPLVSSPTHTHCVGRKARPENQSY